ncbi:nuclear transport factor 2 family protein [Frankia sp. R82]|uniref:nuclear transport factor 2 family protein n=1 Tax=Frankia sp. R82 TaxID=2950553 RepID=UPI00204412E2|nr:nuclear transport factor 2 family protein [Frankia sp. R82]MCM3886334.1 nuclear transport factor 2 family protein [Frankia sp. R82]
MTHPAHTPHVPGPAGSPGTGDASWRPTEAEPTAQVQAWLETLADRLYAAWAQTDGRARTQLLAGCCADRVSYANPLGAAVGVEGFSDLIGGFLGPYPGHRPVRVSAVDVHHDRARWEWGLRDSIGQVVLAGLDVTTFDHTGLTSISTFFGPPPPLTRTYTYGSPTYGSPTYGSPRG